MHPMLILKMALFFKWHFWRKFVTVASNSAPVFTLLTKKPFSGTGYQTALIFITLQNSLASPRQKLSNAACPFPAKTIFDW